MEASHRAGIVHREVRANAFHLSAHTGIVRFVHFGNRAVSLENSGSPSNLVLKAFDDEKIKVKEALCYLAPEQTGSIETIAQDHRTDLYSLGILFWTLLVGRGQLPFEGGPLELLHSIVQKTPILVQDVRRDVPEVLGSIIDKVWVVSSKREILTFVVLSCCLNTPIRGIKVRTDSKLISSSVSVDYWLRSPPKCPLSSDLQT